MKKRFRIFFLIFFVSGLGCTSTPIDRENIYMAQYSNKSSEARSSRDCYLIGLTKDQVLSRLGEPAVIKNGVWIYRHSLGPGFHSFRYETELIFRKGKVIKDNKKKVPVGCIIVEPIVSE